MRELSPFEESLVELVHFLAYGNKGERGLTVRQVKQFLLKPIADRKNQTPLDLIARGGDEFLNELKTFINEMND